jgi:hypothetical protein
LAQWLFYRGVFKMSMSAYLPYPSLTDLANCFGSDKGTVTGVGGAPHRYTYLYDILFAPFRTRPLNFLELGLAVLDPKAAVLPTSIQMWLEYFTKAQIFGFDVADFSHMSGPRFTFIRGDMNSESDLRRLAQAALAFDVIIDNGSHAPYHQQLALKLLFPKLGAGGLYIIEGLDWQPTFEDALTSAPKTAEFLIGFFEQGRYIDSSVLSADTMDKFKRVTASFSHFPSFDGTGGPTKLIVLRKREIEREVAETGIAQNEIAFAHHGEPASLRTGDTAPSNVGEETAFPNEYYLVSHHDTILYADAGLRRLRHAPFGIAPLNLALELVGPRGRLIVKGGSPSEVRQLSIAESTGETCTRLGRIVLDLHIETFGDDSIGLRVGKHYVSADQVGLVHSDRDWCRDWEQYRLVRADTLDTIPLLRRYSWLGHSDRRIVSLAAQPINFGHKQPAEASALAAALAPGAIDIRRELVFGPARIRLVGREPSLLVERPERGERDMAARVDIVDAAGIIHRFSRFTPLVYYCVYGDDSFYECLHLSLTSLERYGCFGGAIGIACDRPLHKLAKYIPQTFHHRLIVTKASKQRGWFNQYYLEHGLYDEYQPILYCDVDVIFDTSITDLLIDLLLRGRVCCATEGNSYPQMREIPPRLWDDYKGNFFGRYLYASDPEFYDALASLGNAAVVGFDNTARVRSVNDLVRTVATRQSSDQLRVFSDQPLLNYVLHKTGLGNFDILDRYCRLTRAIEDVPPAGRRGLVHFHLASGAEDALPKVSVMRSYLDELNGHAGESQDDQADVELNFSIPGQMKVEELERLARLARTVPPNGCIVEIGSLFGLTSWTLAKNAYPNVTVYCIDPWVSEPWMLPIEESAGHTLSLETFIKNVSDVPNIIPLRGYSPRDFIGWQRATDLLFVDSAYTNPMLHQNLTFWTPFLRPGGVICGRGYCDGFPDVKSEVDGLAANLVATAQIAETLWSIRLPDDPSAAKAQFARA